MTQRQSLLRYTKSVHKLCMEHGKESDDSDGEGQAPGNQDVKILSAPTKTPSGRMPLESLFSPPKEGTSKRAPITASVSMYPLSPGNSKSPPISPTGDLSSSNGRRLSSSSRRPLSRESASFNLSVRQIRQEGAPKEVHQRPTAGRKDTITVYDWFRAMDEEAEKERVMRGTLRAQGTTRSKTMRPQPTKPPTRVNSNFEFFMKQAQDAAGPDAPKVTPPIAQSELKKSKSLPRVESKWGIFDPPAPKGSVRFFDGGTKKKSNKNDAIMGKQIAEDDASLKVFMQAWNMLDTFEEHLAVHIELDEAEAQRQQMAKEVPPVEAAPQQPFDPSTQLVDLSFNSPSFPFDSPAMGANRHLLPPDLVLLLTPDVIAAVATPNSPSISSFPLPMPEEKTKPLDNFQSIFFRPSTPEVPATPITQEVSTTISEPVKQTESTPAPIEPVPTESPRPTELAPIKESPRPTEPAPIRELPMPTEPTPIKESPRPTEPVITKESPRPTESAPIKESPRPGETLIKESPRPTEPAPSKESPRPTEPTPIKESPRPTEPTSIKESPRPVEPTKESPRPTEPTPIKESPRLAAPALEPVTQVEPTPVAASPRLKTEPAAVVVSVSPRLAEPAPVAASPRLPAPAVAASPRLTTEPAQESTLKQELLAALTTTTAPTADVEPVKPTPVHVAAIPEDYDGPHYSSPIPQDFLENLFQYCATEGTSSMVPRAYVEHIIRDATELFKSEPTIIDIPLDSNSKAIVVGDIHGQFPDLITILRDTGLPGPKQTIVFNGDFVDRGPAGVEVLLCLYCMKLQFPKNVYIHRGNHELESINRKYNFAEQVVSKYDDALFLLIQDSFGFLPLGCVIAKKVLVIHGGLPEDPVSLNQIRNLPKLRDDPTKAQGGPEKIVQGILWSDPRERRGVKPSKRGAGVEFGPDVTAAFLARSDLDLLVRSHEMVEEGFQLAHGGNVMTIFSASYYCGVSTNKGAFAVFAAGTDMKKPTIVQYYAQAYAARDNVLKSCVKETLQKLREMIFVNRHRLCVDFCSRDAKNTGKITKADWCASMSSVMGLHIGWQGMLPYLAKVENEKINFSKFLDRYKITKDDDEDDDDDDEDEEAKKRDKIEAKLKEWQKETMGYMCANMHAMVSTSLPDAFAKFDKDKDGKLSYKEFMDALESLRMDLTPADDNQYYDMMRRMDVDADGMLSLKDFEESLSTLMERVHTLHKEEWIPAAVIIMKAAIDKNFDFIANQKSRLKSAFRKCRAEGGKVQRRGFTDWIERALEIESFTSVQKLRLAMYVDFNGNGKISWKEFKKVFKIPEYYDTIQSNLFKPAAK